MKDMIRWENKNFDDMGVSSVLLYIQTFIQRKQTNKDGVRATTAQLYPGRDTFEFDRGRVTKNQPITVLILLSESLAI